MFGFGGTDGPGSVSIWRRLQRLMETTDVFMNHAIVCLADRLECQDHDRS